MPEEITIDQILANLKAQNNIPGSVGEAPDYSQFSLKGAQRGFTPTAMAPQKKGLDMVEYTVNPLAIYDRLRDGTYVSRYENFMGQEGNEDRLAKEQSTAEQWGYGLLKNSQKTLNYAFDATIGTVWGIMEGAWTGEFEHIWDNSLSQSMDDLNKRLDYNLPNYYTDEQKSMGFLESMGTANFWANDVAGGMAFIGGSLIPELVIGAFTGGATIPGSLAKLGVKTAAKTGFKKLAKEGVETFAKRGMFKGDDLLKMRHAETSTDFVRALNRAKYGENVGNVLNTGRFLLQSSNYEAAMEARHNFHDAMNDFYRTFEDKNGRPATHDEMAQFTRDAVTAANYVYGANMAILAVSNTAMFSDTFKVGVKTRARIKNAGNRFIGLGVKKTPGAKIAMQEASRGKKILGNTYMVLSKPAVEGIWEEGLQGVAGTTMQNYLEAKYNPEIEDSYGMWASLTDAFSHQYGSKEGWKEMGIGMIIGFSGGAIQGQGFAGIRSNSWNARRQQIEGQVDVANKARTNMHNRLTEANSINTFSKVRQSKADNFESTDTDNTLLNVQFIKSQSELKSSSEIKKDFDAIVDNTEFTGSQLDEIGGEQGVMEYKQALKDEFSRNMENYNDAKRFVKALQLPVAMKDLKDTQLGPGNIYEIEDAMIMGIVAGKNSLEAARNVATQIDAIIGSDGVFNHLEHYSNLSQDKKGKLDELRKKKQRVKRLRTQALKYANQLEGLRTGGRKFTSETQRKRFESNSEKYVVANQEIGTLEQEINELNEALSADLRAENLNIDQLTSTDVDAYDITQMVEEIDKLDTYVDSLRKSGRSQDAAILENLIEEYKAHSDAHREMNNTFRRMTDTNFFRKKDGKKLVDRILGKRYKMSDEFRQMLKENDAIVDKSLKAVGYRGKDTVEELVKKATEENEELSERGKHRLESLIRLQLGYQKMTDRIEEIQDETVIVESTDAKTPNPLTGDTVTLKQTINPEGKDLSNLDVINELIEQITSEIESFKEGRMADAKRAELNSELETLNKLKEERSKNPLSPEEQTFLKGLREDLKVEENEELGNPADAKKLRQQISELESREVTPEMQQETENRIAEIEKELDELGTKGVAKIMQSKDYRRMYDLTEKKQSEEGLTEEEQEELDQLSEDFDQWIELTGTVAEGLRLSDLMTQKVVLETTKIADVETVGEITSSEVIDSVDLPDETGSANYQLGQTYEGVTAIGAKGKVKIAGIKYDTLKDKVGFEFPYETNDQGNIIITPETRDYINENSDVSILPTNQNLTTNYSMVLETVTNPDGTTTTSAMKSDYIEDYEKTMVPDAVYEMSPGDVITFEVDPNDEFHRELFEEYKKTKSEKKRKSILKKLKKSMVIRILSEDGTFVAVGKGKRASGTKTAEGMKYEMLRDQIVEEEGFIERLAGSGVAEEIENVGEVTVKKVYLGHPNFNFTKNEDGTVSIVERELTEQDIQKIEDIGYVQNGETLTHSGKGNLDMTFMNKALRNKSESKIPFIVFTKGNVRVAYPVSVAEDGLMDNTEFEKIYNSSSDPVTKAAKLNEFMASRGVDIKLPGNSFIAVGKTNLNDEFFSDKLAQLNSIKYFSGIDDWVSKKSNMQQILSSGVSTNISLSDPLHSPKVQLDYSGLNVSVSMAEMPESSPKEVVTKGVDDMMNQLKEDC